MQASYTVSIFSQSRQSWRTIQVETLADCVRLTLGLNTDWRIQPKYRSFIATNGIGNCPEFYRQYNHALRSLVARWKQKYNHPVNYYRMGDIELFDHVSWSGVDYFNAIRHLYSVQPINPLHVW